MTSKTKDEIKAFFETGDKPTEAQFIDFIDSYVDKSGPIGVIETIASGGTSGFARVSGGTGEVLTDAQTRTALNITVYTTALASAVASDVINDKFDQDLNTTDTVSFSAASVNGIPLQPVSALYTPELLFVNVSYGTQSGKNRRILDVEFNDIDMTVSGLDTTDASTFTLSGFPRSEEVRGRAQAYCNIHASTLINATVHDYIVPVFDPAAPGSSRLFFSKINGSAYRYDDVNASGAKIFNSAGRLVISSTFLS